jgi:hypothetical protein
LFHPPEDFAGVSLHDVSQASSSPHRPLQRIPAIAGHIGSVATRLLSEMVEPV